MKTKKVRFVQSLAGEHFSYRFGEIADVEEVFANQMIAAEICTEVASGSFGVTCPGCGNQFSVAAPVAASDTDAKPDSKVSKGK